MTEELIMVGERSLAGGAIQCRRNCGWGVRMDDRVAKVLALGGSVLCLECAMEIAEEHPEAFSHPASDVDV